MKDHAKTQAPIIAERQAGRLADILRQSFQFAAENLGDVFAWVRPASNGNGIGGVRFRGGIVRRELG
jgi:hypothetical protein